MTASKKTYKFYCLDAVRATLTNLKFNVCFVECNKVSFKDYALLVVNFLLSTVSSVR